MTTYTSFLTALAKLSVSGVTRRYEMGDTPPASLNAGELPAQWVQRPGGDAEPVMFDPATAWPTFSAQLIIAVQPVAQSTGPQIFSAMVTLIDALITALDGADLAESAPSWTIRDARITVAGTDYWGVVAEVKADG